MLKISSFSFQNLLNHPYNEQSNYLENLSNLNQNSRQDLNWKPLRARKSFIPLNSTATFPHCNGTLLTVVTQQKSQHLKPIKAQRGSVGKLFKAINSIFTEHKDFAPLYYWLLHILSQTAGLISPNHADEAIKHVLYHKTHNQHSGKTKRTLSFDCISVVM